MAIHHADLSGVPPATLICRHGRRLLQELACGKRLAQQVFCASLLRSDSQARRLFGMRRWRRRSVAQTEHAPACRSGCQVSSSGPCGERASSAERRLYVPIPCARENQASPVAFTAGKSGNEIVVLLLPALRFGHHFTGRLRHAWLWLSRFAGNCRTMALCPGTKSVSRTMAPFENSSASWC